MVRLAWLSKAVAAAGFAGVAATGAALAADMPVKAPPPAAYYDWSGAYAGFGIGGVWADVHRFYPQPLAGPPLDSTSRSNDVIYGFQAGAQWQWGQWVLGVEAGYSAGFREMQSSVAVPSPPFQQNISDYNKITNLFTLGPRLGFAWDRWMIYGTGGWASADLKGQYIQTSTGLQTLAFAHGQSRHNGWFAGGGFEYMVHKGALVDVVFGAEYQHFDLGSKNTFCVSPGCNPPGFDTFDYRMDAKGDIVRARLTIKTQGYGWWGAP